MGLNHSMKKEFLPGYLSGLGVVVERSITEMSVAVDRRAERRFGYVSISLTLVVNSPVGSTRTSFPPKNLDDRVEERLPLGCLASRRILC